MQFKSFVAFVATLLLTSTVSGQAMDWHNAEAVADAALERHPALATLAARIDAAEERTRAAGAYPNPMVMAGVQDQQIDLTRDEMMTMYMVGASQTIPRKGRRDALKRSAGLDVEQLRLEARSLREELRRDVLFAYYDLATADSQTTATEQLGAAVDAIVAAARFRYEVGTTIQADVIRAQLQRSDIEHQLLTLGGRRRTAASRLLAQLGLPVTTEIPRLHLAHATEAKAIDGVPTVPQDHPALASVATAVEQREQDIRLAKLIAKPDWNLEASYGMRPTQKDMISVVARIELPIRRQSVIEPQIRAAVAERDAAAQQLDEVRRQLLEALGVAYVQHAEATKQLQLHEQVLVPQSKLAFDSTLAAYQSGKENFEAVLSTETAWLRLEIDYYDFLAQHIKAITDFEAIQRGARTGASGGGGMNVAPIATVPAGSSANAMSSMR
ncbi:MAG TPA: TolC family protein [Thermoanaerobaculia bacterium]|nr:TolC family protein [Thermoanaerobaculia bacterium]